MSSPIPISEPWGIGSGAGSVGGGVVMPPNIAAARGGGSIPRSLEIPLPEVYPIPDAKEFNILGSFASGAASANTLITGSAFDIPSGSLAIIRGFTAYIAPMSLATNVTWSLVWNGQALAGYQNITIFPRPAAFASDAFDAFLRVRGPGTLSVIFSNIDGAIYQIGASYSGWFWPEASAWKAAGE
jgi:hypothetical protein